MNSLTPSAIMRSPEVRRRGFMTLVTLLAMGAVLAMLALSSAPPTRVTMAPAAAAAGETTADGTASTTASATAPTVTEPTATAAGSSTAGSSKTTTAPVTTMPTTMPAASCDGLQSSVDAFLQHFYAAHLETSPGQQVADATDADQYTKTHTVLLENMLKPLLGGTTSALDVFLQHVYAAHLEASPGQQVADATDVDQYVKTHTVMVENMLKPLAGADLSSC